MHQQLTEVDRQRTQCEFSSHKDIQQCRASRGPTASGEPILRYYIVSEHLSGKRFAEATRGHWGIENNLHWQLDVTFGEDRCRLRKGHADANFSVLRRTALSLLKNEPTAEVGIKNKRLIAGWSDEYLAKVLFNQ